MDGQVDGESRGETDSTRTRSTFVGHDPDEARRLVCRHTLISLDRETENAPETFAQWQSQVHAEGIETFFAEKPFTRKPQI